MIVDDNFNYHSRLNTLSFTIINYHQLSCSLDMFKFEMIVHDSFFRLTERMIVHDSFSGSGGNQDGLNAIWLPHCHRRVKKNKAIISTNIRTTGTLRARKWEKRKNLKKTGNEKWSGSLICNLIDEYEAQPCLWNIFCDDYHNRDVTGNNTALKFNVREGITSVSKKILRSDASTLRDFDKLSGTIMDMIVNDSEW